MAEHKNTSFWSSNIGFILACVGAAVGLGNIWKFPSMAGENGGAAFTLIYLICIFALGLGPAKLDLLLVPLVLNNKLLVPCLYALI